MIFTRNLRREVRMKSNSFNILYRVCDSVENYNSYRITGNKKDIIVKSFTSLCDSIAVAKRKVRGIDIVLHIVYDKTGVETKNKLKEIAKEKQVDLVEHSTSNGQYGNMASFKLCYDIALKMKGYIFFLEDDYLLDSRCIAEMFLFLNMWKDDNHVCLRPHEDLMEFLENQIVDNHYRQKDIFLGNTTYWFRDTTSTCTFCIDDYILDHCKDKFESTFTLERVEEKYLNQIYHSFPLFAPIPSLGIHFQSNMTFPPFFQRELFETVEYDTKGVSPL